MLNWLFFVLCVLRVGDVFILMFWMAALDDRWDQDAAPTATGLRRVLFSRMVFAALSIAAGTACFFGVFLILFVVVACLFDPQSDSARESLDTFGLLALALAEVSALTALHAWLLKWVYGTAWSRAIAIGLYYVLSFLAMWTVTLFLANHASGWYPPGP